MTRTEFIDRQAQLARLARRALAWVGVPVVISTLLMMAWQMWYMRPIGLASRQGQSTVHRYGIPLLSAPSEQLFPDKQEVILANLAALGIYTAVIGGSIRGMFHFLRPHAPKCERCGKTIWVNRGRLVLADGLCPFCRQPLFPS